MPLIEDEGPSGWDMFGSVAGMIGPALMAKGFNMPGLAMMGPQLAQMQRQSKERERGRAERQRWQQMLSDPQGAFGALTDAQRQVATQLGPEKGASMVGGWMKPSEPKPTDLSPGKAWGALSDLSVKPPQDWTERDKAKWTGAYGVVSQPKMSLQPDPATGMMMPIYTQPQIPFPERPWEDEQQAAPAAAPVSQAQTPAPAQAPRLTPQQAAKAQAAQSSYDAAMGDLDAYADYLARVESGYAPRGDLYAEGQQHQQALLKALASLADSGVIQNAEAERYMESLVDVTSPGVSSVVRYGTDPVPEARKALEVLRKRVGNAYEARMKTYGTPGAPTYRPRQLGEEAQSPVSETSSGVKFRILD